MPFLAAGEVEVWFRRAAAQRAEDPRQVERRRSRRAGALPLNLTLPSLWWRHAADVHLTSDIWLWRVAIMGVVRLTSNH